MRRDQEYFIREIRYCKNELEQLLLTLNRYIQEYNTKKNSVEGVNSIYLKKWYTSNVVPVHALIKKKRTKIKELSKKLDKLKR